jgi:hypothetical protein
MHAQALAFCSPSRDHLAPLDAGLARASANALPPGWVEASALAEIDRRLAAIAPVSARSILADAWVFLFALSTLSEDTDLTTGEIELRLGQLVDCASGRPSPEVAFDPLAIFGCALADRLQSEAQSATLWPAWTAGLCEVASALLSARSTLERLAALAPAIDAAAWMLLDEAVPTAA